MSNLSDIGFPVHSEQDVNEIIMGILGDLEKMPCPPHGFYFKFEDQSGSQIFLQTNPAQEIIGFNPAFNGESRRELRIKEKHERDTSALDGVFVAEADDDEKREVVFDAPDFRIHAGIAEKETVTVSLTAFASNDLKIRPGESADQSDLAFGKVRSLPTLGADKETAGGPPQAHARIRALIRKSTLSMNSHTGAKFYALVAETIGGEIDVVLDPALIESEPKPGDLVTGNFWISGRIL